MNEITRLSDKRMSAKELSDIFGCDTHTITNHANRLFPGKIQNGVKTYFDEREAALILESIKSVKSQNNTLKVDLQGMETALTPTLKLAQLAELIERSHREIEAIKDAEIERLKQKAAEDAPKVGYYEALVDRNHLTNFRDTAKEIGIPEKRFISILEAKGYVYRDSRGKIKPYHDKMEYFSIKDWEKGEITGTQTFITVTGKEHFLRLFGSSSLEASA
jgi:phage antirepressor YoqD-like protein